MSTTSQLSEDCTPERQDAVEADWSPWVYLKLEWGERSCDRRGILLTINFNKHHREILGGRVWFGLNGGELTLKPENSEIPYDDRWPETSIIVKTEIKHKIGKTTGSKETKGSSGELKAEASLKDAKATSGLSQSKAIEKATNITREDEFKYERIHVSTKGSETEAIWCFEVSEGNPCLHGSLIEKEIGKLIVHTEPYAIETSFRIFMKDIRPLDAEGIWKPEDLGSTSKIRKIKEKILLALLKKEIVKMDLVTHSFELTQQN